MSEQSTVFLVHGRNVPAQNEVSRFLLSLGLSVTSWSLARESTKRPNPTTLEIALAGITRSDATVILLTGDDAAFLHPSLGPGRRRYQPRPNVLFETGIALSHSSDRTLLVQLGEADLMSDIDGLNIICLDNRPEVRRDFVRRLGTCGLSVNDSGDEWLDPQRGGDFDVLGEMDPALPIIDTTSTEIGDLTPEATPEASKDLEQAKEIEAVANELRGSYMPYLVDTGVSLRLSNEVMFAEIRERLRQGKSIDLKYHYVGSRLAEYWAGVVRDPAYGHQLLSNTTGESVQEILEHCEFDDGDIDYISLGSGDGEFDKVFLPHLARAMRVHSFFPVDISFDLLKNAVVNMRDAIEETDVHVQGFVGDFEDGGLQDFTFLMRGDRPALYSLAGFTLGNMSEQTLMDAIRLALRPSDRLLVDIRLHPFGNVQKATDLSAQDVDTLMEPYSSTAVSQFAFGPVQAATDYALDLDDVSMVKRPLAGHSAVPCSISVFLSCQGLYQLKHTKFLRAIGFNTSTKKDEMAIRSRSRWLVDLAQVTFYDLPSLVQWFENHGWTVVWKRLMASKTIGVLLLARKDDWDGLGDADYPS